MNFANTFFVTRLGAEGAKYLSKSVLLFTAGISSIYACLITKDKSDITPIKMIDMFAKGVKSIYSCSFNIVIPSSSLRFTFSFILASTIFLFK